MSPDFCDVTHSIRVVEEGPTEGLFPAVEKLEVEDDEEDRYGELIPLEVEVIA